MAKLAVIVPVYNVEPYITDCINSLIQQTMHDIDIICVDDCGTDKSMKIVEQFAQQDKRIKIVHNDKNSGLSESRNNGVRACNAEYIMFCDSDDFFMRLIVATARTTNVAMPATVLDFFIL